MTNLPRSDQCTIWPGNGGTICPGSDPTSWPGSGPTIWPGSGAVIWPLNDGTTCFGNGGSTWTYAEPPSRAWWGGLWADRVRYSRFAEQAVEYGLSDTGELERMAEAFLRWADSDDGVFVITHVEILARD